MGEVVSLKDYRLQKAIGSISEIYCNDPAVFEMYSAKLMEWEFMRRLNNLDAQIERLDKLIYNQPNGINIRLLQEKNKISQTRMNLIKEFNKKGS
jgi:hypothetical protein